MYSILGVYITLLMEKCKNAHQPQPLSWFHRTAPGPACKKPGKLTCRASWMKGEGVYERSSLLQASATSLFISDSSPVLAGTNRSANSDRSSLR